MSAIFKAATSVSTPLALAGLIGAVLFFVIRQILRRQESVQLVSRILTLLTTLFFAAMVFGFAGYVYRLRAEEQNKVQQHRPCEGEWRVHFDYSKLHNETEPKYIGKGNAIITWKPVDESYDVILWVTVAPEADGGNPLLTSVTRTTIAADRNGKPTAKSIELEYLAQTGRAPYDKPPAAALEYTDLQFEPSADAKRVDGITCKYHSARTDAAIRFSRK
jgi:hypothetical protein